MADLIWMKLMKAGSRLGCHQRADRSFSVGHYQFPVCARCMGILISTIIAYITFLKEEKHMVFRGTKENEVRKEEIANYIKMFLRGGSKWKKIWKEKI